MGKIKLNNIDDLDEFFKTVESCKGAVELIGDGMRLNLKSKLAQYFSMAKCFSGGHIGELELEVYEEEDFVRILKYAIG